jgi:hypothetical protein
VFNFISVKVVAFSLELILKHTPMFIPTVIIVLNIFLQLPSVLTLLHIILRVKETVLRFSSATLIFANIRVLSFASSPVCHCIRRTIMEI